MRWKSAGLSASVCVAAVAAVTGPAAAQTALPGIVIETPSPVVRQRPAPSPVEPGPVTADPTLPGILVDPGQSFASVTVVDERAILSSDGATLTDELSTRPGIIGTTFAPAANRPIIRGLDSYRVRVQENGIGSHDVSALSEDHAVPIDPLVAQKVEVVRGPATLRYGSQAIGGVVEVSNNRIPAFVPPGGFSAAIKGGLNSVDEGRDAAFDVLRE